MLSANTDYLKLMQNSKVLKPPIYNKLNEIINSSNDDQKKLDALVGINEIIKELDLDKLR